MQHVFERKATFAHHGRRKINRYEWPKKLLAAFHLWVRMQMMFVFQVLLHVPFFFSRSFSAISLLNEFKPSEPEIGISRIVWRRKFDRIHSAQLVQNEFAVRHAFEKEGAFWLKSNLQSQNLTSRESNEEENLKQFIQEIGSKTVQTEFAVRHAFEREVAFWLKSNLQSSNLASRESNGKLILHFFANA